LRNAGAHDAGADDGGAGDRLGSICGAGPASARFFARSWRKKIWIRLRQVPVSRSSSMPLRSNASDSEIVLECRA